MKHLSVAMCWILPAKRCSDFKWNPNENVRCPFGYWKTADSFVGNRYLGEKIFVCHVKSVPQPPRGSQCLDVSDNLLWHAQEKAPYKEAAGASTRTNSQDNQETTATTA
ncbi:MAG: hypothetical protein WAK31_26980 [Chthoniobacterales bacterium]